MSFAQFNENYELRQILGHGTQSTVRKVIRRDTLQVFAAKIYESMQMVKARHEIDMLVKLDHPSIVNIYEVYQEQNCVILILDYMAGGQLYQQISQRKHLNQSLVRNYIRVLIDAVRYCHELNVIHRDIKPQNLLLTTQGPDGLLKLSDFGISKILSDDELNTICGTPIYMAPEIWEMVPYNNKVDVWSMGVVTYYMLSGEYPFSGQNTQQLMKKITKQQVKFSSKIWQSISSRAIVLLREMLNKNPAKRPSAAEIQHHIWFNDVEPITRLMEEDPNLLDAIISISRQKLKTKRIRKQRELHHIFNPMNLSKVRVKFLLLRQQQQTKSQISMQQS